jgi:hypothetical protein
MDRRGLRSALATAAVAAGGLAGCGGGASTTSTALDRDDATAKRHLVVAYREGEQARRDDLRCSTGPARPCRHPEWYPSVRIVQAEVGSAKLHQLKVAVAASTEGVRQQGVTYIVAGETRSASITWAEKTPEGTLWVLRGSPSGYHVAKRASSDD